MTFELQYVPHARVFEFEMNGWRVVSRLKGSHHGIWSVLMRRDFADDAA
jgi:hypothetical protein